MAKTNFQYEKRQRELEKKKKADEMPKPGLGILDLATGKAVTVDRVKGFKLPDESGRLVAYLLEAPIRCLDDAGRGILTFRWLDAQGNVIDVASEEVAPGQEIADQFLWRRAPEGAARVQAEFSMAGPSRCEFSGAALYELG